MHLLVVGHDTYCIHLHSQYEMFIVLQDDLFHVT